MKLLPIVYKYQGRWWYGEMCTIGMLKSSFFDYIREFIWCCRNGEWYFQWNYPLIFGIGRTWHDGPIWFAHLAFFSISVTAGQ